ncbi:hypothetical protein [Acinetobacter lactucae]|uniref:hypothetical protein n=1 Tax=Acinetobacter lactucae TaxID=1785128 RepID=UPI0003DF9FEB|nr:hypothetical protein [Acinetobacter lactucae]ETR94496.1 hypothetical protein M211_2171 [Acinetobacter lactucae]HCA5286148.1 hypothetical protein [Acinetobacter nosocomialis]
MDSLLAINDFREENNLEVDNRGNLPPFECIIEYKSKAGNASTVANVRLTIHGIDFGNIDIDETKKISSENYHLNFTTRFQQYKFDSEDNSLIISGTSAKMQGAYEVKLKVL